MVNLLSFPPSHSPHVSPAYALIPCLSSLRKPQPPLLSSSALLGSLPPSFLAELRPTAAAGGCSASSLASMAWALSHTKHKKRFVEARRAALLELASECDGRWVEGLHQSATGGGWKEGQRAMARESVASLLEGKGSRTCGKVVCLFHTRLPHPRQPSSHLL